MAEVLTFDDMLAAVLDNDFGLSEESEEQESEAMYVYHRRPSWDRDQVKLLGRDVSDQNIFDDGSMDKAMAVRGERSDPGSPPWW